MTPIENANEKIVQRYLAVLGFGMNLLVKGWVEYGLFLPGGAAVNTASRLDA